jgi:hypothetical protein
MVDRMSLRAGVAALRRICRRSNMSLRGGVAALRRTHPLAARSCCLKKFFSEQSSFQNQPYFVGTFHAFRQLNSRNQVGLFYRPSVALPLDLTHNEIFSSSRKCSPDFKKPEPARALASDLAMTTSRLFHPIPDLSILGGVPCRRSNMSLRVRRVWAYEATCHCECAAFGRTKQSPWSPRARLLAAHRPKCAANPITNLAQTAMLSILHSPFNS